MSEERKNYAIKGLNVMACMFVSSYHDTIKTYGTYDTDKHNQLYLKQFKDFGYAGSRMDDFLSFYEMYANTIEVGIPIRKLIEKKTERVANSQLGFSDFVNDKIMQLVPMAKLDEFIVKNCNGNFRDIVMTPNAKQSGPGTTAVRSSKKPWFKNVYVWVAVISVVVLIVVGILLFIFVFKKPKISNAPKNSINTGYKTNTHVVV
jgi:hypothetical protein